MHTNDTDNCIGELLKDALKTRREQKEYNDKNNTEELLKNYRKSDRGLIYEFCKNAKSISGEPNIKKDDHRLINKDISKSTDENNDDLVEKIDDLIGEYKGEFISGSIFLNSLYKMVNDHIDRKIDSYRKEIKNYDNRIKELNNLKNNKGDM